MPDHFIGVGHVYPVSTVETTVTAAYNDEDGDVIDATTHSQRVRLSNSFGQSPVEYKVGAGAWTQLERQQTVDLTADLAATTIALRRTLNSEASIVVTTTITGWPGGNQLTDERLDWD